MSFMQIGIAFHKFWYVSIHQEWCKGIVALQDRTEMDTQMPNGNQRIRSQRTS